MKKLILLITFLIFFGLYLNRAYAHIYNTVRSGGFTNPNIQTVYTISAPQGDSKKTFTYVALGDSLTAGVGGNTFNESYPYQIAKRIAKQFNTEVTLVNLAVPGATASDILATQIPQVFAYHPSLITLMVGTNDTHNQVGVGKFRKNLQTIFSELKKISTLQTNIVIPPFLGNGIIMYPPYQSYFKWQTARYNNALKMEANKIYTNIIDLDQLVFKQGHDFVEYNYYSRDSFHPSDFGYTQWANLIYSKLHFPQP